MAAPITSSIKLSPPLPKPMVSLSPRSEIGWRNRCISTSAFLIIGFSGVNADAVAAREPIIDEIGNITMRWSDRRGCPAWHANMLENTVPENLPRPSTRRGFNDVAAYGTRTAPAVGVSARYNDTCYSL